MPNYRFNSRRLRAARAEKMLTQHDLEAESGVSYTQISRLETGQHPTPRPETIKKLARALDVDPRYLIEVDAPE